MKKLIVGILIGLALGAAPTIADWGDTPLSPVLKEIKQHVAAGSAALIELRRIEAQRLEVEQWQARSLQRIVWVLERKFPAPPEKQAR